MLGTVQAAVMGSAGTTAAGAITEDARTTYNGDVAADPHTFNHTAGASADFLVVLIAFESVRDVVDVKWGGSGGTSLTKDAGSSVEHGNGAINSQIWYLAAPATGTQEVWVDLTASDGNFGIEAVTLVGVHQTTPVADSDSGLATSLDGVVVDAALVPDGTNWLEVCAVDGRGNAGQTYTWSGSLVADAAEDVGPNWFVAAHQADVESNVTPSVDRDQASGDSDWAISAILLRAA